MSDPSIVAENLTKRYGSFTALSNLNMKKALGSVGALIESPEIYPALTPREALSMVADLRGLPRAEAKKKIEETVAEVKMNEWLDKKVGKFSKGMKQRINIAAALL